MPVYKFAGFWRRLIAYLIDSTIISIVLVILWMIAMMAFFIGAMSGENSNWITDLPNPEILFSVVIIVLIFITVLAITYFTYFHGLTGRTPGKMLLGLQVVNEDGTPVTFGIAFLRSVGYLVSSLLFTFPAGFIWAAFDKRKQGWHDKIAGTVVIIREEQNQTGGISISDSPAIASAANVQKDETPQVPQNNN